MPRREAGARPAKESSEPAPEPAEELTLDVEDAAIASPTVDPALAAGGMVATTRSRRRPRNIGAWMAAGWLVLVGLLAVLAPFLPLRHPERDNDFLAIGQTPTADHWLGTDQSGRDILSRLIWGSRVALIVGLLSVAIGMLVGGTLGLLAGYYRGRLETALMAVADIMLSFPALVFVIAVQVFLGQNLRNVTIAIGIVAIPAFARVTRAATLALAQREFVMAARSMGAKNRRILRREILPNAILPVTAFGLVIVAVAIVAEGALSFLGLSVPKPQPSWGSMIAEGRGDLQEGTPHISFIPAAAMFLTVLSFNLLGDRFRAVFDVRESRL